MVTPPSLPHHVVVLLTRDELPNNDAATSTETIVDVNRNEETKDKIKVTMNILCLISCVLNFGREPFSPPLYLFVDNCFGVMYTL